MQVTGASFTDTYDHAAFKPGGIAWSDGGDAYQFVKFREDVVLGHAVAVKHRFGHNDVEEAEAGRTQAANTNAGSRIGVVNVAASADEYGWVQVFGITKVLTANGTVANARVYTTGANLNANVRGILDDTNSASASEIKGFEFTDGRDNATELSPCLLTFPVAIT